MSSGPSARRGCRRRCASAQAGVWVWIQSRNQASSRRVRGSTVRKRPPRSAMWVRTDRVQSLLSATYKKSGRPTRRRRVSQVARCVWSSEVFPSQARKWTGTAPSALTVRIHNSCLRSGRWSLLYPWVITNVGRAPRAAPRPRPPPPRGDPRPPPATNRPPPPPPDPIVVEPGPLVGRQPQLGWLQRGGPFLQPVDGRPLHPEGPEQQRERQGRG